MARNVASGFLAILFVINPSGAAAQDHAPVSVFHPFPPLEFHFSDPGRDAEYWRLQAEVEHALAVAREALNRARAALKQPAPKPGTAAWLQARAAVEQAIRAHRPVRDAQVALIAFVTREGPKLSPEEAHRALQTRHVTEESLRGMTDNLVDLLAALAGIKTR
ncbi:MAG TPA: hypothetical protein VF574_14475 [Allosphingosinicella sp.]|jgi:hypothetical protein